MQLGSGASVEILTGSKRQKRMLIKKAKKRKKKVAKRETRVNLRLAFGCWRELCKIKGYKTHAKVDFLLLDL